MLAPEPAQRRQRPTLAGELGVACDADRLASGELTHGAAVRAERFDVTGLVRGQHQHRLVPAADAIVRRASKTGVSAGTGEPTLWTDAQDRAVAGANERREMIGELGHVVVAHG